VLWSQDQGLKTRVLGLEASAPRERESWVASLINSRMKQILHKCSEYAKHRIQIKTSGLWEYGHGQQSEQFIRWLFQKLYYITGVKLVYVFRDCFMQILLQVPRSQSRLSSFLRRSWQQHCLSVRYSTTHRLKDIQTASLDFLLRPMPSLVHMSQC